MNEFQTILSDTANRLFTDNLTKDTRIAAEAKSKVEIAEAVGALRWLRAFWEPGIDHDTQEVQHALAAADAALAKHSEKPDA